MDYPISIHASFAIIKFETYQPAVTNGPSDNTPCITLGADLQREDLGRIQPGDGKPGGAEDEGEHVDHGDGGVTVFVRLANVALCSGVYAETREATGKEEDDTLTNGTPVECVSATNAI